jgi:hypothetical protein
MTSLSLLAPVPTSSRRTLRARGAGPAPRREQTAFSWSGGLLRRRSLPCGAITAGEARRRPASKRRSAPSAGSTVGEPGATIGTALLSYVTMPNFAPQYKRQARVCPAILHFISFPRWHFGTPQGTTDRSRDATRLRAHGASCV